MPRALKSGAQQAEDAPVHHLGPTLSGPVWHLAVGTNGGAQRGGRKTGEKRRKKGEGESGTQEAPETGCGQLFTSWRMIYLGVARLRNLYTWTFGAHRHHRRRRRRCRCTRKEVSKFRSDTAIFTSLLVTFHLPLSFQWFLKR